MILALAAERPHHRKADHHPMRYDRALLQRDW
jgi:hypothetical protein